MVDNLRRDPECMGRALANHLVAAVDPENFQVDAQSRDEATALGADEKVVVGDSALKAFEFCRSRPDIKCSQTLEMDEIGLHDRLGGWGLRRARGLR